MKLISLSDFSWKNSQKIKQLMLDLNNHLHYLQSHLHNRWLAGLASMFHIDLHRRDDVLQGWFLHHTSKSSLFVSILPTCLSWWLMFLCLSVYLPVSMSVSLYTYLSHGLPTCLSVYLPVCLSTYLSHCMPTCLSAYLPVYLSTYLSLILHRGISVYIPVYLI